MRYEHVLAAVCGELWAIDHAKLTEILAVLAHRAAGDTFTPEEIEARIGNRTQGPRAQGSVGVLPIRGTIAHRMGGMDESSGGMSTERMSAMLSQLMADTSVGSILLDVDSPGGTVTGVQEFADELFRAREQGTKRITALVNGMAGSAAYWIASQAHEIVSIPSGLSGSIGVFTAHEDLSKALEQKGITVSLISAGKHKVDGLPFTPLSEAHREYLQSRVDATYGEFVKAVARGRGVSVADVRGGYGEGRPLPAKDAKAAGLIDRIATVEDTLGRLLGRSGAGLKADAEAPELVAETGDDADIAAAVALDVDARIRLQLL